MKCPNCDFPYGFRTNRCFPGEREYLKFNPEGDSFYCTNCDSYMDWKHYSAKSILELLH